MNRYGYGSCVIFFFFFIFPLVLSQLPNGQISTMIKLAALVNSNNTASHHWDTTDPNPCSWKGVNCSSNPISINHLSLSGFGISGSEFLTLVCQINSLQSLDLSNNFLTSIPAGFIRDCAELNGLKMLNFSKNRLSGFLPDFNGFGELQFLDLSYNSFGGNITLQLDGLVGLRSLNLSTNQFRGSLPTKFGRSMVLEELQLSTNHFEGRIPEELMAYRNLTLIDLSENKLSGSVPDRIGELSKLVTLILSSNKLSGAVPNRLSMIETLSRFGANENSFTGGIPPGISRYLKNLDLSYNSLNGLIPSDLLSQSNLQSVDLSNNSLEGPIPTNISSSLFRLRLGSNSLNGSIPSVAIGKLSKLTYLELDKNGLSGGIPPELGSCQNLQLLNLAQNKLTGELPIQLGNLSDLQVMKLQSNRLFGEIPEQFVQLQKLSILNISWNSLSGSIPSSVSRLYKLSNLNLKGNNLSGPIPDSIGSLNFLTELQLGSNRLSGKIPRMPTKLSIALDLSRNLFEGPIPHTFGELTALEVLDLSDNRLTGYVPSGLLGMTSLTQLLLSNNQLSGILPDFPAFVYVDINGNKDLRRATPNPTFTSSKKRLSAGVVVAIAVAAAVLGVGFTALIVVLFSRHLYRVNDEVIQSEEHLPASQVISSNLITTNSIHRSNLDFDKAMEAVGNPSNIILKSKFSTYYVAVMPSGRSYYVKKINWSDKIFQLGSNERFGQELEVLGRLSNSNVMIPLAYVLTADNAYLFYEYTQRGTLFDALHGSLENALDWGSRYAIAVGVAHGLAFLHGCTAGPILLLDLSTKSILLKSSKEPQVGDIELCKVIDPSKSTGSLSTVAGSVGYIPPEYAYTMRVTMPGNVYSFGVILLELLTGKPAVSGGIELAKWVLNNSKQQNGWDQILDYSVSKTSTGVRSQMLSVLKIALGCVSASPEARPKMKNVLNMLLNAKLSQA